MTPKELCLLLVQAQSEEEVSKIIESNEILADERNWAPYGGLENNAGTFLNQQSNAVASLTEKIVNAIDAILLSECRKRGIDPEGTKAPRTMQEAVEQFLGIKDGNFSEVAKELRREIASNIMVIAEGSRKRPNSIVIDRGEGQNPKDFEDTFLSLHKKNKNKIPFVQGKFNMGSTGAIPFCGEKHCQLILSRRHPSFLTGSQRDFWGFTLVRYREAYRFEKSGIFEYCHNKGDILKFEGEPLSILPDNQVFEYGSFVKMYEYKLERASSIQLDLWRDLNRFLFNPAIPVLLYEARDYKCHSPDKILLGNRMRLKVDDNKFVEDTFSIDAVLGKFGTCRIEVIVLGEDVPKNSGRTKDEFTTQNDTVFFTINGQTHATLGRSFLKSERKAGLDYFADYLIVHINLSDIPSGVRDHVFMGSRDRMRDDEIKRGVEEDLGEVLRNHEGLRRLNEQRRDHAVTSNPKDDAFLKRLLEQLVKSNSSVAEILGIGVDIPHQKPGNQPDDIKFEGKYCPTFLEILNCNSTEEIFCKKVPINSYAIIKLETDAENHYLDRDKDQGKLIVNPPGIKQSSHLYNGIITLKIVPRKDWKVDEKYHITVQLTRCNDKPLAIEFDVQVSHEIETRVNPPTQPPSKGKLLRLPKPVLVYRNKTELENCRTWEQMNPPWTEKDIVEVKSTLINVDSKEKQYDVFINMDSDDLHSFLKRKRLSGNEQDFVKRLY